MTSTASLSCLLRITVETFDQIYYFCHYLMYLDFNVSRLNDKWKARHHTLIQFLCRFNKMSNSDGDMTSSIESVLI